MTHRKDTSLKVMGGCLIISSLSFSSIAVSYAEDLPTSSQQPSATNPESVSTELGNFADSSTPGNQSGAELEDPPGAIVLPDPEDHPVEPTQPVEPVDPVEPTEPAQPTQPVEPNEPVEPTQPVLPEENIQPGVPTQPVQPADPTTPVIPTTPADPTQPVDGQDPATPATPTQPVLPAEPTTPLDPEVSPAPENTLTPAQPGAEETIAPLTPTLPAEENNQSQELPQIPPTAPAVPQLPQTNGPLEQPLQPGANSTLGVPRNLPRQADSVPDPIQGAFAPPLLSPETSTPAPRAHEPISDQSTMERFSGILQGSPGTEASAPSEVKGPENAALWVHSYLNQGKETGGHSFSGITSGVASAGDQKQSSSTVLTNEALTRGQAIIEGFTPAILFSLLGVGIIFFVTREYTRSTRKEP